MEVYKQEEKEIRKEGNSISKERWKEYFVKLLDGVELEGEDEEKERKNEGRV